MLILSRSSDQTKRMESKAPRSIPPLSLGRGATCNVVEKSEKG